MRLSTYPTNVYLCPSTSATPDYPRRVAGWSLGSVGQPEGTQRAAACRRTPVRSRPGRLSEFVRHANRRHDRHCLTWFTPPAFGDSGAVLQGG